MKMIFYIHFNKSLFIFCTICRFGYLTLANIADFVKVARKILYNTGLFWRCSFPVALGKHYQKRASIVSKISLAFNILSLF